MTWSCSPTETPPQTISDVGLERRRRAPPASPRGSSATRPTRTDLGAGARGQRRRACSELESRIAPGPQRLAAVSSSSSPLATTATRGRRWQATGRAPSEASTPSSAGPSRVPAPQNRLLRRAMSSPARRTLRPGRGLGLDQDPPVVAAGCPRREPRRRRRRASSPRSRSRSPRLRPGRARAGRPARDSPANRSATGALGPRPRGVRRPHREAVHRRVVEARHRFLAENLLRQHPSQRGAQRQQLGRERGGAVKDGSSRPLNLDQLRRHLSR